MLSSAAFARRLAACCFALAAPEAALDLLPLVLSLERLRVPPLAALAAVATFLPPARLFAVARASLLWPTRLVPPLAPASEPTTASPLHLFVFLLRPDRSPPHATFSEVPGFPSSAPAPPPVAVPPSRSDSESARLPEGASPPGIRRTPGPPHENIFSRARVLRATCGAAAPRASASFTPRLHLLAPGRAAPRRAAPRRPPDAPP